MTEAWRIQAGERIDKAYDYFIDAHPEMSFRSINVAGEIIVLLEQTDLELKDFKLIEGIIKKQKKVEKDGIYGNCFVIAAESVKDKTSDGVLYADLDAGRLVGFANHAANYKKLPDGSVLAVDYTSPANYDVGRGVYKTLAIHARTKEQLKRYLEELNGGDWWEGTADQIKTNFRSH